MIITSTMILIASSTVAGSVIAMLTYPTVKSEVSKQMEIYRMRKKIQLLIDDIEDKDPDSLHNIICDITPCYEPVILN